MGIEKDGEYPYFWGHKVTSVFRSSLPVSLSLLFFVFFYLTPFTFFSSSSLSFLFCAGGFGPGEAGGGSSGEMRVGAERMTRTARNREERPTELLPRGQGREVQEPKVCRPVEARRLRLWLRYPSVLRCYVP